jgi:hypothetical protein
VLGNALANVLLLPQVFRKFCALSDDNPEHRERLTIGQLNQELDQLAQGQLDKKADAFR